MITARRTMAAAVAAVLTVTLGACSSGEESDSSDKSSSQGPSDAPAKDAQPAGQTAFTPQDVTDPGEDQLGRVRVGKVFAGSLFMASWKFPTSYDTEALENTRAYTADDHFRITIQAGSGDQAAAAAAMANAQRQAKAKGQKASLHTVSVKGREFAVLVQDTPEAAIITYAHAPEEDVKFYIIQLATDISLADVPQEQLDAFQQTLGSLKFERA